MTMQSLMTGCTAGRSFFGGGGLMRLAVVGGPFPMIARPEGDLAFGGAEAFGEEARTGVSTLDGLGAFGLVGGGVGVGSLETRTGLLGADTFGASAGFVVSTTGFGGGGMLLYPLLVGAVEARGVCVVAAGEGGCEVRASYCRGVALYGLGETYVSDGSLRRFVIDADARA